MNLSECPRTSLEGTSGSLSCCMIVQCVWAMAMPCTVPFRRIAWLCFKVNLVIVWAIKIDKDCGKKQVGTFKLRNKKVLKEFGYAIDTYSASIYSRFSNRCLL